MFTMFRKTEYIEFDRYKRMIDRLDDLHFMDYLAKKQMRC